jgi:hypothetical protein
MLRQPVSQSSGYDPGVTFQGDTHGQIDAAGRQHYSHYVPPGLINQHDDKVIRKICGNLTKKDVQPGSIRSGKNKKRHFPISSLTPVKSHGRPAIFK